MTIQVSGWCSAVTGAVTVRPPRVVMGSWVRVPHPSSTFLFVFSTNVFIPLCPGGSLNVKKTLTLSVDLESSVLSKKQKKREVVVLLVMGEGG